MNIIDREWSVQPFRYRVISVLNLVKDFQWRRASDWSILKHNRDDIVDYCIDADSLPRAIERACRSKRPNGKHHNHQSKVPAQTLTVLEHRLRIAIVAVRKAKTFDALYNVIDEIKPEGIGPVTTYDVAVRIGAYRGLTPDMLYLHAGARDGLHALYTHFGKPMPRTDRIPITDLPTPMHVLTPDEVEDFLCVYRHVFPLLGTAWPPTRTDGHDNTANV